MDRDSDIHLANRIVDSARRRVITLPPQPRMEELYRPTLLAAAWVALASLLFLRRTELAIIFAGAGVVLVALTVLLQ